MGGPVGDRPKATAKIPAVRSQEDGLCKLNKWILLVSIV